MLVAQGGSISFQVSGCDGNKTKTNQKTVIEVINLPDVHSISILCDGKEFRDYTIIDDSNGVQFVSRSAIRDMQAKV